MDVFYCECLWKRLHAGSHSTITGMLAKSSKRLFFKTWKLLLLLHSSTNLMRNKYRQMWASADIACRLHVLHRRLEVAWRNVGLLPSQYWHLFLLSSDESQTHSWAQLRSNDIAREKLHLSFHIGDSCNYHVTAMAPFSSMLWLRFFKKKRNLCKWKYRVFRQSRLTQKLKLSCKSCWRKVIKLTRQFWTSSLTREMIPSCQ